MRLATLVLAGVATVQDGGRLGHEDWGVPISGALHRGRYEAACLLLTGSASSGIPTIELLGGEVVVDGDHDLDIAVVGPADVEVDGRQAASGVVLRGRETWIGRRGPGPVYVAVAGWQAHRTLGSSATDSFSGLGPSPLRDRDELHGEVVPSARVGMFIRPEPDGSGPLRVVDAGAPVLPRFVSQSWRVSSVARSGLRMLPSAPLPASSSMPSAPLVPGAIQLTPSGEAIVVGPDGGVSGGYLVVGVVATADLDRLSLLGVGDVARFQTVDPAVSAIIAPRSTVVLSPDHLG